jgi:hypothetical protein
VVTIQSIERIYTTQEGFHGIMVRTLNFEGHLYNSIAKKQIMQLKMGEGPEYNFSETWKWLIGIWKYVHYY